MMKYKYSTLAVAIVALLSGCGAEDNKSLSDNNNNIKAPTLKGDVTIPALHVGMTAQGNYEFFDPNPTQRPEGTSLYIWRNITTDGEELSTQRTLKLGHDLLGNAIEFCVTPVAQGSVNPVGDEVCSEPRIVQEQLGEKPVVDESTIELSSDAVVATPIVGDTLTATYDYSHSDTNSEGESKFSWYANKDSKREKIADANQRSLELTPSNSEGKTIEFCVTPETKELPPVRGDESCSEPSNKVVMAYNNMPPFIEVGSHEIVGEAVEGATLTGKYIWDDADGDVKAPSVYSWKRGVNVIADANAISYVTNSDDVGEVLSFCVQPRALTGVAEDLVVGPTCLDMDKAIEANDNKPPTAGPVTIVVPGNKLFEVGTTVTGLYKYNQAESIIEGPSTARWIIGGLDAVDAEESVKDDVACEGEGESAIEACSYTLSTAALGKDVQFCVTPVTTNNKPGTEACSAEKVQPMGIMLNGSLAYMGDITATIHGYDDAVLDVPAMTAEEVNAESYWAVETRNQDGPAGDTDAASAREQARGLSYIIRSKAYNAELGIKDLVHTGSYAKNGVTGVIDDYDWLVGGIANGALKYDDASHFIGKSLYFCFESVAYGSKCVSAADYTDSVSGGLYTNSSDATERYIEPVREMYRVPSYFHRPLTQAETVLAAELGFGEIPVATGSIESNGIVWATYRPYENIDDVTPETPLGTGESLQLNTCRNLYSTADKKGVWNLPTSRSDSKDYIQNIYGDKNISIAPYLTKLSIESISAGTTSDNNPDNTLRKTLETSMTTGWPLGQSSQTSYSTATLNKGVNLNVVRFYLSGSSANNGSADRESLVSCIRPE